MKAKEKKDLDALLTEAYILDLQRAEEFISSRDMPPRTIRPDAAALDLSVSKWFRRPAGWPALILQGAAVLALILLSFSGVTQGKFHNSPLSREISELAGNEEILGWIKHDLPRDWYQVIRSFGGEERNE